MSRIQRSDRLNLFLSEVEAVIQGEISKLRDKTLEGAMNSVSGGKMLRPALVFATYELLKGQYRKESILGTAAGIEMAHRATLLPDDLLDGSDTRRGKPSVYKEYGPEIAILAPYAVMPMALFLITKEARSHGLSENNLLNIEKSLSDSVRDLVVGQVSDLRGTERVFDEVLNCVASKNCLFRLACNLPPIYCGLNNESIQKISGFGSSLGTFYQIADDYLDQTGDSSELGKPVRQDGDSVAIRLGLEKTLELLRDKKKTLVRNLFDINVPRNEDFENVVREIIDLPFL